MTAESQVGVAFGHDEAARKLAGLSVILSRRTDESENSGYFVSENDEIEGLRHRRRLEN